MGFKRSTGIALAISAGAILLNNANDQQEFNQKRLEFDLSEEMAIRYMLIAKVLTHHEKRQEIISSGLTLECLTALCRDSVREKVREDFFTDFLAMPENKRMQLREEVMLARIRTCIADAKTSAEQSLQKQPADCAAVDTQQLIISHLRTLIDTSLATLARIEAQLDALQQQDRSE